MLEACHNIYNYPNENLNNTVKKKDGFEYTQCLIGRCNPFGGKKKEKNHFKQIFLSDSCDKVWILFILLIGTWSESRFLEKAQIIS